MRRAGSSLPWGKRSLAMFQSELVVRSLDNKAQPFFFSGREVKNSRTAYMSECASSVAVIPPSISTKKSGKT